jgi:HSP20 family molecular chaperone IbpA
LPQNPGPFGRKQSQNRRSEFELPAIKRSTTITSISTIDIYEDERKIVLKLQPGIPEKDLDVSVGRKP